MTITSPNDERFASAVLGYRQDRAAQAQPALVLVLRFNAFTGQLEDGYLANRQTMLLIGKPMKRAEALAYLIANPETRCDPIKV